MAMLAEPRRFRKKYNLVPRGKALFEDENRFGTKMLERMGWSKGKGLGAREDGTQDFVRVRYKHDSNGVGYEDRDDQWTEHEKHFNGLLNSLNNSEANSETEELGTRTGFGFEPKKKSKEDNEKDKISGESLEAKSKQSRARVHYKKFTKGKDLSQYSEKDLANIFGKKTDNTNFQKFDPIVIPNENNDINDSKKFGITTINTGTSVADYFKQKMEEKKSKSMLTPFVDSDPVEDEPTKKKAKKQIYLDKSNEGKLHEEEETGKISEKSKMKKSKKNKTKEHSKEILDHIIDPSVNEGKKIKKNRKNNEILSEEIKDVSVKKSKKKKRNMENSINNDIEQSENTTKKDSDELESNTHKKSKSKTQKLENLNKVEAKNKKRKLEDIANHDEILEEECSDKITHKKPKKKKKLHLKTSVNDEELENTEKSTQIENEEEKSKQSKLNLQINETEFLTNNISKEPAIEQSTNSLYIISQYCAEKFRHTDLNRFPGSNLPDIIGYGLDNDLKMEIVKCAFDFQNITNLWSNVYDTATTDKYSKCPLKKYAQQVQKAKIDKKKLPKINIKKFKNKSVFKKI